MLVENGANVNYTGSGLGTPLYLACQNENVAVVNYLVYRGADINNNSNYNRETPIIQACRNLNKDIVKFLIKEGADINVANLHGVTPISLLCRCVSKGNESAFSIIKLLIRNGVNLNVVENDDVTTPLLIASRYRNAKLVALLIENGALVRSNYNESIKQFIKETERNIYPSVDKRREIKEALIARDIEGLGACLYEYLEIKDLMKEDDSVEGLKKVHRAKKYVYSLKDGEEFRKVIREIKEIRKLISISKNDSYLNSRVTELNEKLELDMEIFSLVNKLQLKLENLEEEKCWKRGRDIDRNMVLKRKAGGIQRASL